ncbi:MAG: type I-B CRISPR-associated protein Cas7/Csh2 [Aminivibrio sp.]|jgi:CRISPR-associated protein Csh2
MAFENRREYLFIYSVKDANPNGDPLNANAPRKDEETGQIMVSDVRVKRTVRDQWIREGKTVFVDGEARTLNDRMKSLKEETGSKKASEAIGKCIDARLFGATCAIGGESFSWCGPLQLKWGRSLHKVREQFVQGTAAFARKDDSEQRSFRNEYIVPFCIIACYGIANQNASKVTGASDEDLGEFFNAVWGGTENLISRSKIGHTPLLLLEVAYKKGFNGAIGALDEMICLTDKNGAALDNDAQYALRSVENALLDASKLTKAIDMKKDEIDSVRLVFDNRLPVAGKDELKNILGGKLKEETR